MAEQRNPAESPDRIGMAHRIASQLWDAGIRGPDGGVILAMALGIYVEAQEGCSHRNIWPLVGAMMKAAQMAFDALREGREREPGNA